MKIALISDIHDRLDHLQSVLNEIAKRDVSTLLFCGDFNAPFAFKALAEGFTKPIHVIFGNNEGDKFAIAMAARPHAHVTLHGEYAALELGGRKVGLTHYPFYAEAMAKSGDFDLVGFGHDHEPRILTFGKCLAVNPGSVMGNKASAGFALYDTKTHQAELINLFDLA